MILLEQFKLELSIILPNISLQINKIMQSNDKKKLARATKKISKTIYDIKTACIQEHGSSFYDAEEFEAIIKEVREKDMLIKVTDGEI